MKYIFQILLFFCSGSLSAHPHVWVEASIKLHFNKAKEIIAITQIWEFDDMFSMAIIKDNDKNGDGIFDSKELEGVRKNYFYNLNEYGFFTYFFENGKRLMINYDIKGFRAEIIDDKVMYVFKMILSKPVNPFLKNIDLGVYDPEYYMEIAYSEDAVICAEKESCPYFIFKDENHPSYFGLINPDTISLCRKKK